MIPTETWHGQVEDSKFVPHLGYRPHQRIVTLTLSAGTPEEDARRMITQEAVEKFGTSRILDVWKDEE